MADLDVLVVDNEGDPHSQAVIEELLELGVSALRYNLADLRRNLITVRPGVMKLVTEGHRYRITPKTTVWWRRYGRVEVSDLEHEEAQLAQDECPHILNGALQSAAVRWVDDPNDVDRAELKVFQLQAASRLGIRFPDSLVTNDPALARQFTAGRRCVAKALSPGTGIAPFTDTVTDADIDLLSQLPALLQEKISATADLRIVVIGDEAWMWRRPRNQSTVDWRSRDPNGSDFVRATEDNNILDRARQVTSALGLSMAVQDWLETDDGPVFLESNAQGNWLFLRGARDIVAPALARHLAGQTAIGKGKWPSPAKRFKNDFLLAKYAPNNDGAIAPPFIEPGWISEVAARPGALDVARRANDQGRTSASVAETKAHRQVQISLSVLTLAFVVGGIQLRLVANEHWTWLFTLVPVVYALVCLIISAFEALQVDRVGFYHHPSGQSIATLGAGDCDARLLAAEEKGRQLAQWTSRNKHTDLMQARAWFTRGLAVLIMATVVMLASWLLLDNDPTSVMLIPFED